jgi:hypothetical protein
VVFRGDVFRRLFVLQELFDAVETSFKFRILALGRGGALLK